MSRYSLVGVGSGLAVSLLEFFNPISSTWIGHPKWASDNLKLAALVGSIVGIFVFLAFWKRRRRLRLSIAAASIGVFLLCAIVTLTCAVTINSVVRMEDIVFVRDTIWRISHLSMWTMAAIALSSLSLISPTK